MEAAAAGEPEGSVFFAEEQTAGPRPRQQYMGVGAIGRHLLLGQFCVRNWLRRMRCCCH